MAKAFRQPILWKIKGRRHLFSSVALMIGGPLTGLLLAGSVLKSTGADANAPVDLARGIEGATALMLGVFLATYTFSLAVRRLRRYAIAGTSELIIVSAKKRIYVPYGEVKSVVLTSFEDLPTKRFPALLLTNGALVVIPGGVSKNATQEILTVDVGSDPPPAPPPLAWRLARKILNVDVATGPPPAPPPLAWRLARKILNVDVATGPPPAPPPLAWRLAREVQSRLPTAAPGSRKELSFSYQLRQRVSAPPLDVITRRDDRSVGFTKLILTRGPLALFISLMISLRLAAHDHGSLLSADLLIRAVTVLVFTTTIFYLLWRINVAEVQLGGNWIAVRRNHARSWLLMPVNAVVGVTALEGSSRLSEKLRTWYRICDVTGMAVVVNGAFLTEEMAQQFLKIFEESDALAPSAIEALRTTRALSNL